MGKAGSLRSNTVHRGTRRSQCVKLVRDGGYEMMIQCSVKPVTRENHCVPNDPVAGETRVIVTGYSPPLLRHRRLSFHYSGDKNKHRPGYKYIEVKDSLPLMPSWPCTENGEAQQDDF